MTEAEWHSSNYAYDLLEFIRSTASPRKLRLFAIGCCRLVWQRLPEASRIAVAVAERFSDGDATWDELQAAIRLAPQGKKFGGSWTSYNPIQIKPYAQAQRTVLTLQETDAFEAAWNAARESMTLAQAQQCDVIRDLFGNPFHPQPETELIAENSVQQLASDIYRTSQFERITELGTILQSAGCNDKAMLDHCRVVSNHFRGCWVIDLLLTLN